MGDKKKNGGCHEVQETEEEGLFFLRASERNFREQPPWEHEDTERVVEAEKESREFFRKRAQ